MVLYILLWLISGCGAEVRRGFAEERKVLVSLPFGLSQRRRFVGFVYSPVAHNGLWRKGTLRFRRGAQSVGFIAVRLEPTAVCLKTKKITLFAAFNSYSSL